MLRTRVGYAGGNTTAPTYLDLEKHSETVQVDYDPTVVSYEELLDVFWKSHNPTSPSYSPQYASIIFYHSEEQRQLAEASKAREAERLGRTIYTEIRPFKAFYRAEDYHQKYNLRQSRVVMEQLKQVYPTVDEFVDSTVVARTNGQVGGWTTKAQLEKQLQKLGLAEDTVGVLTSSLR